MVPEPDSPPPATRWRLRDIVLALVVVALVGGAAWRALSSGCFPFGC